jgi:hypothetical protein
MQIVPVKPTLRACLTRMAKASMFSISATLPGRPKQAR